MKKLFLLLSLSACTPLSEDGKMGSVQQFSAQNFNVSVSKASPADEQPSFKGVLTAEKAIYIALLNNKGLQASFNELGITEAQLVQSVMPASPTLSFAQLANPSMLEIEKTVLVNVLALLTLPTRQEIAGKNLEQAQFKAIEEVLKLASNTKRAFYEAVASQEQVTLLTQAQNTAKALSQFIKKLGETGAVNKLDQAREHVFYAETTAQLGAARLNHLANKEKLTRLLGREHSFSLSKFPALPTKLKETRHFEQLALNNRVDLKMMVIGLEAQAITLGLTKTTRFINLLEVKVINIQDKDKIIGHTDKRRGAEFEVQIPLFDFGQARTREQEESWKRQLNLIAERAIHIRSQAREASARYQATHQLARHYEREILPLRDIIKNETLLRYNAMIIDVLGLINEAKMRLNSQTQALEAKRNFWLANSDLQFVILGGFNGSTLNTAATPTPTNEKAH